eukprot:COSAG06_NODE_12232_length_1406_cov_91.019128_1_plen_74_part_10
MGFARPAAEAALAQAGGDIHAASNIALATPAEPQGAARPVRTQHARPSHRTAAWPKTRPALARAQCLAVHAASS